MIRCLLLLTQEMTKTPSPSIYSVVIIQVGHSSLSPLYLNSLSVITMYTEEGEPREFKGSLLEVVQKIINETCTKLGVKAGGSGSAAPAKPPIRTSGSGL